MIWIEYFCFCVYDGRDIKIIEYCYYYFLVGYWKNKRNGRKRRWGVLCIIQMSELGVEGGGQYYYMG